MAIKQSTKYDGDNLNFTTGIFGDTKALTLSFWFKRNSIVGRQYIYENGGGKLHVYMEDSRFYVHGTNNAGTLILYLSITDNAAIFSDTTSWHHIVLSFDLSDTSKRFYYLDGEVTPTTTWVIYTNDILATGDGPAKIATTGDSSMDYIGELSDIYMSNEYIDLGLKGNLRKFISSDKKCVWLGTHGELPTGSSPKGYFPDGGLADNKGTGPKYASISHTPVAGSEPPVSTSRWRYGKYFDGNSSTDGYSRTSDLLDNANGKQFTISVWVRGTSVPPSGMIYHSRNGTFQLGFSNNRFQIVARNTANSLILDISTSVITDNNLHHIVASVDLSDVNKRAIYVDGVSDLAVVDTYIDDTIYFSQTTHGVGRDVIGGQYFKGMISQLWIDHATGSQPTGHYLDLSITANREKFRTSDGLAPMLGPDGSWPTGSQPILYMSSPSEHNAGSGGDFVVTGNPYEVKGPYSTTIDPVVNNIQSGSLSLLAPNTSISHTITTVDQTKSFILISVSSNAGDTANQLVTAKFTNSTTITFSRVGSGGDIQINWQVVEFSQGVSVQHGFVNNLTSINTTYALSSIDPARTIPLITVQNSGTVRSADDLVRPVLENADKLALYSPSGSADRFTAYQVIEFDNAFATRVDSYLDTAESEIQDKTGFRLDINKTMLDATMESSDSIINNQELPYAILLEDRLSFRRYLGTSASEIKISTYMIEIGNVLRAQHYQMTIDGSTSIKIQKIRSVNVSNTLLKGTGLYSQWGSDESATDYSDKDQWKWALNSEVEVQASRATSDTEESRNCVQVLEWVNSVDYNLWGFRREIILDTTSLHSNILTTQFSTPVLIRFTSSNFDFNDADDNGEDIRFTLNDKVTALDYQIERWDPSLELGEVWVRVPTIPGNKSSSFLMFHGKSGQVDKSSGEHVFLNKFILTDHMNETSPVVDSTNTTNGQNTIGNKVVAKIAEGHEQSSYNDYREFDDSDTYNNTSLLEQNQNASWSIWIKPYLDLDSLAYKQTLMSKGVNTGSTGQDWLLSIFAGGGIALELWDGSGFPNIRIDPGNWIINTWYLISLNYNQDTKTVEIFVNGSSIGTGSFAPDKTFADGNGMPIRIGRHYNLTDSSWFDGVMDEARISNTLRTKDWYKLQYENQKTSGTLVTVGPIIDQVVTVDDGIISGEAFDDPMMITGNVSISIDNGISSAEAFDNPVIIVGQAAIDVSNGISSQESFDNPTLIAGEVTIGVDNGISSAEAFLDPSIYVGGMGISISDGISTGEAFDAPVVENNIMVVPDAIPSDEGFDSPTIHSGSPTLTLDGIASEETFDNPTVTIPEALIVMLGIASEEIVPNDVAVIPEVVSIKLDGISSEETFENPIISRTKITIKLDGIASEETFDNPTMIPGSRAVEVNNGISSEESFDSLALKLGYPITINDGIPSGEVVDPPNIASDNRIILNDGIPSGEVVDPPTVSFPGTVYMAGIESEETFDDPFISFDQLVAIDDGISSGEKFDDPTVVQVIRNEFLSSIMT